MRSHDHSGDQKRGDGQQTDDQVSTSHGGGIIVASKNLNTKTQRHQDTKTLRRELYSLCLPAFVSLCWGSWPLLVAQRLSRIQPRDAEGWDETGRGGDHDHAEGHGREREGV